MAPAQMPARKEKNGALVAQEEEETLPNLTLARRQRLAFPLLSRLAVSVSRARYAEQWRQ